MQGEDRGDDAEAAGCDAAVLSFPSAVFLLVSRAVFFICFFSFSIGVDNRRDGNGWLCDAPRGVCRRGEEDWKCIAFLQFQ